MCELLNQDCQGPSSRELTCLQHAAHGPEALQRDHEHAPARAGHQFKKERKGNRRAAQAQAHQAPEHHQRLHIASLRLQSRSG